MNGFVDRASSHARFRMSYVKCDAHPSPRLLDHVDCAESPAPRIVSLAALFIAVIDRNATWSEAGQFFAQGQRKRPNGMSWTCANGKRFLPVMNVAINVSTARRGQLHKESKVTHVATPHAPREGMAAPFPSTPTRVNTLAWQETPGGSHGFAVV